MRLLVTGGRHLDDVALIHRALIRVHTQSPLSVLIHGGHAFLGAAVEEWGRDMRLHVLRYPANWWEFGRRAEGIRNDFMLSDSRPDLVLALPGGNDTRALALAALGRGLPVFDHNGQAQRDCLPRRMPVAADVTSGRAGLPLPCTHSPLVP